MNQEVFIKKLESTYRPGEPIFAREILQLFPNYSRMQINRYVDLSLENNELTQYSKGVYSIPKQTPFGQRSTTAEEVVTKRFISDKKEVYGTYGGLKLLNAFALTTQVPNVIEIISNNESSRGRNYRIGKRSYIVKKSRCKIDKDNVDAYTLLELMNSIKKGDEVSNNIIKQFVADKNITYKQISKLLPFFPNKASANLLKSGVLLDGTTRE